MITAPSNYASSKRYHLESPAHLLRGILSVAVAIVLVSAGFSTASAGSESIPLDRIVVAQGDSIWELAEKYAGDADTETWILDLANLNDLQSSVLIPGQTLLLPAN